MLQPINQEQVQQTAQVLLSYLDDPNNSTPNSQLEGIVSGKSLLRGILAGNLMICQNIEVPHGAGDGPIDSPTPKKAAKKKAAKKAAA